MYMICSYTITEQGKMEVLWPLSVSEYLYAILQYTSIDNHAEDDSGAGVYQMCRK